jgi:hypothetical protein
MPTHFGLSGQANAWGGKRSLLGLVGVSLFIYILLTILSRFPQGYNLQWSVTKQNKEVQYKLDRLILQILKAEVLWIFAYINWICVQGAFDKGTDLGNAFLSVSLSLIFATIGVYIWRSFRVK